MTRKETFLKLQEPFEAKDIKWKIQSYIPAKNKALLVCYVDARDVMQKLDSDVGLGNWKTIRTQIRSGDPKHKYVIQTEIQICVDNTWLTGYTDVGMGDDPKTAYSDSLKRAAVHLGIGRHLYDGEVVWADTYAKAGDVKNGVAHRSPLPQSKGGGAVFFAIPASSNKRLFGKKFSEIQECATNISNLIGLDHKEAFLSELNELMEEAEIKNMYYYMHKEYDEIVRKINNKEFKFQQ
jgi:hypothetical protein